MKTPQGGRFPTYHISELEGIGRDLLGRRFPGGVVVPVDIDLILEGTPSVTLDILPGIQSRFGVRGVVLGHPEEKRFTAVIDAELYDNSETIARFTVAEELAHVILHGSVMDEISTPEEAVELQASAEYEELDRNAKWLASALLMPAEALRSDVAERFQAIAGQARSSPSVVVRALTTSLARRYVVSTSAMTYRLRHWPLMSYDAIERALREGKDSL